MDKINVNMLVPNLQSVNDLTYNTLDVNTLSSMNKLNDSASNFNIESLIKVRKEKREKLLETYIKYYNMCIEKIKALNNRNILDVIFEVPSHVPECYGYKSIDCIEFISNKLKLLYMDTYKMNINTLFITWKYIEANRENDKRFK